MTADLAAWILARVADDEAVARAASKGHVWTWADGGEVLLTDHRSAFGRECIIDTEGANPPGPKPGAHIARHDPARVLAECTALRAVLEIHAPVEVYRERPLACTTCVKADEGGDYVIDEPEAVWPCPTLRALASIWADHPDFDPTWRLT